MTDRQPRYTTQLNAGLGLIAETRILLDLWRPGMTPAALYQAALDSGAFSNVTARRLRNIVVECFAPRYLVTADYPAAVLKTIANSLSATEWAQLLFLFTCRANAILADFVKQVYWTRYAGGHDVIRNQDARDFVLEANRKGHTRRYWADSTIQRVSGYLTGCCADFGLLEPGRKSVRRMMPFRIQPMIVALLAYDLHFAGLGDNTLIAHPDWALFGLLKQDLKADMQRLSRKGFFILQSAGDVISLGWRYQNWEELLHVIAE